MPNEPFYSSLSAQEIEGILVGVNDSSGLLLRNVLGQIRGAVGGQDYEVPPVIQAADPTASTVGVVGQLLINTTRHSLFVCSYAYGGRYTWTPVRINNLTPEEIASIISLDSAVAEYQSSSSGETPPTGEWSTSIPEVAPGFYLWTRVSIKFSGADPIVYYSVSRQGINGTGAVSTVNNVYPDANGNVQLAAANVGAVPMEGFVPASNPNLLDNPWFTVHQRDLTALPNSAAQTPFTDRWICARAQGTVGIGYVKFAWNGVDRTEGYIQQRFENNTTNNALLGKTATFSVLIDGRLYSGTFTIPSSGAVRIFNDLDVEATCNYWGTASVAFAINIFNKSRTELTVTAVKLELGSVSTLANDNAPDYATELLKCQRYYYVYNQWYRACAKPNQTNVAHFSFPFPIKMRTTPALQYTLTEGNAPTWINANEYGIESWSDNGVYSLTNIIADANL